MKKKIENRCGDKEDEFIQTSTSISFQPESLRSISRCSTLSCSQRTMEENSEQPSTSDFQTSFRRDSVSLQAEERTYNPNLKKSKILLVQIDKKSSRMGINDSKVLSSQAEQLAEIERKTQQLVGRENQQRRQLKKMKQLYLQKVEEIKKQQKQKDEYVKQFSEERSEMESEKERILQEKDEVEEQMREMQKNYLATREEVIVMEHERQSLMNRVELLQANFDLDAKEPLIGSESFEDINRRVQIVEQSIIGLKSEERVDYCKLAQLLETKCQFMQQREAILREECKRREVSRISLFNQMLLSRNAVLERKNMEIQQLRRTNSLVQLTAQKEMMDTASSTFFGTHEADGQQSENIQEVNREDEWDELKMKTLFSIEASVLKGHEESYEAVRRVAMGMLQIFSGQQFGMEDISSLVDHVLKRLSNDLVEKARTQLRKASLLSRSMS